jgi:hypothetical protein
MKKLAAVLFFGVLVFCGNAQISQGSTNVIRTPELLYITTSSNVTAISNAIKMASSLRIDMTKPEVENYLYEHGMQTNVTETLSLDRGRTVGYFYQLPGNRSNLVLEMECTERTSIRVAWLEKSGAEEGLHSESGRRYHFYRTDESCPLIVSALTKRKKISHGRLGNKSLR